MSTVCKNGKCSGCKACIDICPRGAISFSDNLTYLEANIDEGKCIECNLCHKVCQENNPPDFHNPITWYQGWTKDQHVREGASSGGIASALAIAFINNGGVVCSCKLMNGDFHYQISNSIRALEGCAGSKYVKSNPEGAYKSIRKYLVQGTKVLLIGLPCHVAAARNYVGQTLENELYTVDLICHGTPSLLLLKNFLKQYGYELDNTSDLKFRNKAHFAIGDSYKSVVVKGGTDRYSLAFLNSLIYTENCYECKYARLERVSDITLGDSWNSELPKDEQQQGISLVLYQTEKGKKLLEISNLCLHSVDIDKAVSANHQLREPSTKPAAYKDIFEKLKNGNKFNSVIFRYLPLKCIKQNIKQFLLKTKCMRGGGKIIYSVSIQEQK